MHQSDYPPDRIAEDTAITRSEVERNVLLVTYVLYGLGFFALLPAIGGVIINHVKLHECRDDVALTHHRWLMRTFWFGLLWFVVCTVLSGIVIGLIGFAVLWVWCLYRFVRGVLAYIEHRPMPGPNV